MPSPRLLGTMTRKNKMKLRVIASLSTPPKDNDDDVSSASVGPSTGDPLRGPSRSSNVDGRGPHAPSPRSDGVGAGQGIVRTSRASPGPIVPPSPQQLRAALTGNVMRSRSDGPIIDELLSSAGGGHQYPRGVESESSNVASPAASLLPTIGVTQKPVAETQSNSEMRDMHSTKAAHMRRRRNVYIRKASPEEIEYFTDLIKQSMAREARQREVYDDAMIAEEETYHMELAEAEQCRVDRFWGFEYEDWCQAYDGACMAQEDLSSRLIDEEEKLAQKWADWTEQDIRQQREQVCRAEERDEACRQHYIEHFYKSLSVKAVTEYTWPDQGCSPNVSPKRNGSSVSLSRRPPVNSTIGLSPISNFILGRRKQHVMHCSAARWPSPSSSSGAGKADKLSHCPMSVIPEYGGDAEQKMCRRQRPLGWTSDIRPDLETEDDVCLQTVFERIDSGQQGVISRKQFTEALKHMPEVRRLLQNSFVWSLYKAREWSLLLDVFKQGNGSIPASDFVSGLLALRIKHHVPRSCIRRLKSHDRPMLASHFSEPPRLPPGSAVEFLFARGGRWLIGRILCRHIDGTYDIQCCQDLQIPLSDAEAVEQNDGSSDAGNVKQMYRRAIELDTEEERWREVDCLPGVDLLISSDGRALMRQGLDELAANEGVIDDDTYIEVCDSVIDLLKKRN